MKWGLKWRLIYEYRCDERLKIKNEESTRLSDTGLDEPLQSLQKEKKNIYSLSDFKWGRDEQEALAIALKNGVLA